MSSSGILLSFFDTRVMICLSRHTARAVLKISGTVSPNTDLPASEEHIYALKGLCHGSPVDFV